MDFGIIRALLISQRFRLSYNHYVLLVLESRLVNPPKATFSKDGTICVFYRSGSVLSVCPSPVRGVSLRPSVRSPNSTHMLSIFLLSRRTFTVSWCLYGLSRNTLVHTVCVYERTTGTTTTNNLRMVVIPSGGSSLSLQWFVILSCR